MLLLLCGNFMIEHILINVNKNTESFQYRGGVVNIRKLSNEEKRDIARSSIIAVITTVITRLLLWKLLGW